MSVFDRLKKMDAAELRFRLACETRKIADRARVSIARPAWNRADLAGSLTHTQGVGTEYLRQSASAMDRGDWHAAHRQLALHFSHRPGRFPVSPKDLVALTDRIRMRFPNAATDADDRAERMLAGRYDVLGYREVPFGTPPDWYADPVHARAASRDFWCNIDYLDPRYGDHKITWEINRHQHWLELARAFHLTGDRRYYSAVVDQIENWMAVNPPLHGVNWASMLEIGFRSISWIWALHFFALTAAEEDRSAAPWIVDLLVGVNRQLEHVARNLSRYFSPNTHLSGEALALYVAGQVLPELANSGRWAKVGREILLEEAHRQILADGGHAERSAHYHRYTTDFYLLALLVARWTDDPAVSEFEQAARRTAHFLRDLTDDTGRLPLLGDDDGGQLFPICRREPWDCRDSLASAATILDAPELAVSDPPEEVFWFCGGALNDNCSYRPTRRASTALVDSGYYISRTREGDHLVFDAGQHGYLNGGHAHADALSLCLTLRGRPLIVDAGTATYTTEPALRNHLRSTVMHNTVVVDGRSQSEPGGAFHWQTTTDASAIISRIESSFDYFEGRHAAYQGIVHTRAVAAIHGLGWVIVDHLLGSTDAASDAFWHIDPMWRTVVGEAHVELHSDSLNVALASSEPLGLDNDLEIRIHSPVYGRIERGHCVRVRTRGRLPRSWMTFIAVQRSPAHVGIEQLALTERPSGWHGAAFRLSTAGREFVVLSGLSVSERGESANGSPSQPWGCAELQSDGRFVVADIGEGQASVRIGGSRSLVASSVHS